MAFWTCMGCAGAFRHSVEDAMPFHPSDEGSLRGLEQRIACAQTITTELVVDVLAQACRWLHAHRPAARARIASLLESGAFTDAVLAMLEVELPGWKLRRLLYEDGEW